MNGVVVFGGRERGWGMGELLLDEYSFIWELGKVLRMMEVWVVE